MDRASAHSANAGAILDPGAEGRGPARAGDGAADHRCGDARPEPALPRQEQADGCAVVSVRATRVRGPEKIAGDLAISVETARRQAAEQGHALTCELKVLILHGLLHLAGHDHETDAGEMQRRERSLRARLGLPLGLIERSASPTLSPKTRKDGGAEAKSNHRSFDFDRQDGLRSGGQSNERVET